mmetsp:Transcript_41514/g.30522  ORF Transcript_41514/g.30522 Transcript_41514/m.30522 type:complete len:87 (+) Transcript_41514:170-430(+)
MDERDDHRSNFSLPALQKINRNANVTYLSQERGAPHSEDLPPRDESHLTTVVEKSNVKKKKVKKVKRQPLIFKDDPELPEKRKVKF